LKKDRIPDIHYYEWSLIRWNSSPTRDRMNAAGRGIYRELLDQCYSQGGFPDDAAYVMAKCACTQEEYDRWWPIIRRHFHVSKKDPHMLTNIFADLFRRQYRKYIKDQRERRKKGIDKANEVHGLHDAGSTVVAPRTNQRSTNTIRHDTTRNNIKRGKSTTKAPPTANRQQSRDWIRNWLFEFMEGRWERPDEAIADRVLDAADGASLDEIQAFLVDLHKRGKKPRKSWPWFVEVIQAHFGGRGDGHRAAV
jgi:hypothetical protein